MFPNKNHDLQVTTNMICQIVEDEAGPLFRAPLQPPHHHDHHLLEITTLIVNFFPLLFITGAVNTKRSVHFPSCILVGLSLLVLAFIRTVKTNSKQPCETNITRLLAVCQKKNTKEVFTQFVFRLSLWPGSQILGKSRENKKPSEVRRTWSPPPLQPCPRASIFASVQPSIFIGPLWIAVFTFYKNWKSYPIEKQFLSISACYYLRAWYKLFENLNKALSVLPLILTFMQTFLTGPCNLSAN